MRSITPFLCAMISLSVSSSPIAGADSCKLGGSWRLVAFHAEDIATKAQAHTYGERPSGYMTVTCDGRFSARAGTALTEPVLSIWEDVARALADPAGLVSGIYYWGTYRLDASKIIVRNEEVRNEGWNIHDPIDLLWNEAKSQSDETRNYRLSPNEVGRDTLVIETAAMRSPSGAGNTIVGRVVWERTVLVPAN